MINQLNDNFIDSSIKNFCVNPCLDMTFDCLNIDREDFSYLDDHIASNSERLKDHIYDVIYNEILRRFGWIGKNTSLSSERMLELIANGIIPTPSLDQIRISIDLDESDWLKNLESIRDENVRN